MDITKIGSIRTNLRVCDKSLVFIIGVNASTKIENEAINIFGKLISILTF